MEYQDFTLMILVPHFESKDQKKKREKEGS